MNPEWRLEPETAKCSSMAATAKDVTVLTSEPFNAETPLERHRGLLTPVEMFYVRNHFPIPRGWDGLRLEGALAKPIRLDLDAIKSLPKRMVTATLECAGNGRVFQQPPAAGVQWGVGAVATADWGGTSLANALALAEVDAGAVEILFTGADRGEPQAGHEPVNFERSLPRDIALSELPLLVYEMNGKPLSPEHGAPLRLVVPGWYGVASVKWLTRVTALARPFDGFFQATHYVVDDGSGKPRPLREMAVRALVTSPANRDERPAGSAIQVRGYAWSGAAAISSVAVSSDGGQTWHEADLLPAPSDTWHEWQTTWTPPAAGEFELRARATDAAGNLQPDRAPWNRLGYRNNSIRPVRVRIK
jgi:DMSO/TMAO reductase YedYZ molybdopterin-dependent catalytic subunit